MSLLSFLFGDPMTPEKRKAAEQAVRDSARLHEVSNLPLLIPTIDYEIWD